VHYWHEAIKVKPDFDHAYFNLGYHYYQKEFMREAIRALSEAARINPDAADTHHYLGLSYQATNQLQDAIAEFKKAIELKPREPDYHYNLANASYDSGDFAVAADEWAITLGLRENDSKARNNYCDALLQLGRYDEGLCEIEKVLSSEPDYPPALCTKGELLEKVGRVEEAKGLFARVLELTRDKDAWQPLHKYVIDRKASSESSTVS
jgi:tetratricopeptide (TPR) repeat protein